METITIKANKDWNIFIVETGKGGIEKCEVILGRIRRRCCCDWFPDNGKWSQFEIVDGNFYLMKVVLGDVFWKSIMNQNRQSLLKKIY